MTRTIRLVERKALQPKYYFFFLPFSEATHGAPSCVGCCFLIRSYSSTRLMSAGDTREKLAPFFLLERFSFTLFSRSFCSFFLRWCLFFSPIWPALKRKKRKKPNKSRAPSLCVQSYRKKKEKKKKNSAQATQTRMLRLPGVKPARSRKAALQKHKLASVSDLSVANAERRAFCPLFSYMLFSSPLFLKKKKKNEPLTHLVLKRWCGCVSGGASATVHRGGHDSVKARTKEAFVHSPFTQKISISLYDIPFAKYVNK